MSQDKKAVDEGTRKRLEEMDRYTLSRKFRHMADIIETGSGPILFTPEGRLKFVGRQLDFELTLKEDGTVEAEKLEKESEGRRNAPHFDDVIAEVCDFDYYKQTFGVGRDNDVFSSWIEDAVKETRDGQEALCEEIKGALSSDVEAGVRADLLQRLDDALVEATFFAAERPYVFYGIAAGMRLCGLKPDEIKARMAWLY